MSGEKRMKVPIQTWQAWGFLWVIYAMNGNIREIINRISPYIIDEYNISATTFGLIQTCAFFGLAAGALPLGAWVDKGGAGWKRKYRSFVLAAVYLTACLFCGIPAISGVFAVFFVLNVIRGFTSGAGEACEVGQMMEWAPKERSGFFVGLHHTGYPWGSLLGGLLITLYLSTVGESLWRGVFFIFPIIGFITWAIFINWASASRYKTFNDRARADGFTTQLGDDVEEPYVPPKGLLLRCLKNPNILAVVFISFCCLFCYTGINLWLTPYITFVGNYDPSAAASLSVVFTITGGLGQVFWGNISDKIGTKRSLMICCLWLVVAFALLQFASISLVMLIVLQLFMGCCVNAVYALLYKFCAVSSEKGGAVMCSALCMFGQTIGGGIATYVIGSLIDAGGGWSSASGYYTGLYVLSGMMLVAFFLTFLFTRETNGPKLGKDFSLVSLKSCNLEWVLEKQKVQQ
jgi:MFS family permease